MITRPAVTRRPSWLAEFFFAVAFAAIMYGLVRVAQRWQAPLQSTVEISLSLWALPRYTLLSLVRGFVAYGCSLAFAVVYGYVAAHRPRAERVLLPLLDILQSVPVLGFLPGAVVVLLAMFPHHNAGLELVSILMICSSQAWGMAFSCYQSIKTLPSEMREAAQLYQFNWWQRVRRVELPSAAVGLAWNSMMAMASGWFFLMICEAFTLGGRDFRLPGLGAYMSVAIARHDATAITAGIVAMIVMIVVVDLCVWRPVLVWSQKFRLEDTAAGEAESSLILTWLSGSWFMRETLTRIAHPLSEWLSGTAQPQRTQSAPVRTARRRISMTHISGGLALLLVGAVVVWGAWRLAWLLGALPTREWQQVIWGAGLTCVRVFAAVVLGSLWTIPVGIWIGRSDRRTKHFQPLVQIAASFPTPMLYPLIVLGLGQLGWSLNVTAVLLMALGTQWYILFNVIAGASAVPEDLREVAKAYHFTRWQQWRTLWWPAIFPYLVTGWVT